MIRFSQIHPIYDCRYFPGNSHFDSIKNLRSHSSYHSLDFTDKNDNLGLKWKFWHFPGSSLYMNFIWPHCMHIMSFFLEYMFIDRAFQFLALKCYFSWFWNVRKSLSTYHLISSPPRKPFRTQKSSFQK